MASWLWRRLRGKRRPVTGFCCLLALSMAALTSFSPGLPALGSGPSVEAPPWAGRPLRVREAIPLDKPQGPKMASGGPWAGRASLKTSSLVCKEDGGLGSRGGPSRRPRGKPGRSQGQARRDAAAPGDAGATSDLGMARNIPGRRKGARGPAALRDAWHGHPFRELPIKAFSPGAHLQGGLPQTAGKAAIPPLRQGFGPGQGRPTRPHPDVQAAGAERGAWRPGGEGPAPRPARGPAAGSWPVSAEELRGSVWCDTMPGKGGRLEAEDTPPWFTEDDVRKMRLLAHGEVAGRARVPGHGQVLRVALSPESLRGAPARELGQLCAEGLCGLIKRPEDLSEVLAFHLDRVLGLERSLPAVARRFRSPLLPYRYTRGEPRPAVWWAPDVRHLDDGDNDQNSFALGWLQYRSLLGLRCGVAGSGALLGQAPCLGVHHTEWARLALFDFLLQVHDRLDRYCCGFQPEPSDPCLEERLREKCRNPGELLLVHILVRESDPSRLVYIDNAGKPSHPESKLNFRLLEGIDGFPESAVNVLASGCLQNLLLKSLRMDPEFWESQGGQQGLRPLLRTIEGRGRILLEYIRGHNLTLFREEAQERDGTVLT
ncbi:Golgi-associated kinase 1A [Monodelphis domestica]|uniref:Golgi-associated kinase 1A n=1 Tax=Monodelphis domestica TaxID=13616 RepID=UPI0024E23BEF|nr:Golgi-associated kinase 1A [Monodelphis domestica]